MNTADWNITSLRPVPTSGLGERLGDKREVIIWAIWRSINKFVYTTLKLYEKIYN